MDLIFSWFADAGAWPEHPGSGCAVLDKEVVGPLRLLDHIETMLGLGRPEVAAVQRIAVYRQKIEAAGPGRFWSISFAVDPWSTARELLQWRDELVEAGWKPGGVRERSRLADLGVADASGPVLPMGMADRLRTVIDALTGASALTTFKVVLVDDRSLLPSGWRALLTALESAGATVLQMPVLAPKAASGDLGLLASGDKKVDLSGDGTVVLLSADSEISAAEALSAWLAADAEANRNVTFILGNDTDLLDHALARNGLPKFGVSAPSPHRALLQVLPLAFSLAWEPPDPNRLLDFLLLPTGPLPRSVAWKLAKVVAENPGVGGDEWVAAWGELAADIPDGSDPAKHGAKVSAWRRFLEPARHDPKSGIPRLEASAIADTVSQWAKRRAALDDDGLMASLVRMAGNLSEAIDATGVERLDRVLIERMIEECFSNGVPDPSAVAEAAPWRAVRHPGAVWGEAGTVVWWHFADSSETSAFARWNEAELAALELAGCPLDEPGLKLSLLASAWERPLRHARDRLVMVRPSAVARVDVKDHPLWHSLVARDENIGEKILIRAEEVFANASFTFAGRAVARTAVPVTTPPVPRRNWTANADTIQPRALESASSLEAMLTCPLQWTLRYASGLRPGLRQSLPNPGKLLGILAHRIAEEIFLPGAPPLPDDVEATARRRLTELLPQMAATLLLPEFAAELSAAKAAIPTALGDLARFLHADRLTVIGVESAFSEPDTLAPGFGVAGRIDMRAQNSAGRQVVIDLKWYKTDSYIRRDLKLGTAIQSGVYARHVSDRDVDVRVGYFMLRQSRFITTDPDGSGIVVDGPSAKDCWDRIAASFGAVVADIEAGKIRSAIEHKGLKYPEKYADPYLLASPKCAYCDFDSICGKELT
jgi:hypothetical protein